MARYRDLGFAARRPRWEYEPSADQGNIGGGVKECQFQVTPLGGFSEQDLVIQKPDLLDLPLHLIPEEAPENDLIPFGLQEGHVVREIGILFPTVSG